MLTHDCLQWPDNFDFEATRAINRPVVVVHEKGTSQRSGSIDDSASEKKSAAADVNLEPVSSISAAAAAAEEERELDPVALTKSFRLAAWSSVILVREPPPIQWLD